MKVFEVSFYEDANTYIDGSIENILSAIAVEMKENDIGTRITVTTREMSTEELNTLPEFEGP